MKDRILIDTSAWIESFKKTGNKSLPQLIIKTLDTSQVATTNIIMLELLQGCRDKKEYAEMKMRLESLELLPANGKVWDTAYNAGYNLKKNGLTYFPQPCIFISLMPSELSRPALVVPHLLRSSNHV